MWIYAPPFRGAAAALWLQQTGPASAVQLATVLWPPLQHTTSPQIKDIKAVQNIPPPSRSDAAEWHRGVLLEGPLQGMPLAVSSHAVPPAARGKPAITASTYPTIDGTIVRLSGNFCPFSLAISHAGWRPMTLDVLKADFESSSIGGLGLSIVFGDELENKNGIAGRARPKVLAIVEEEQVARDSSRQDARVQILTEGEVPST